MKFLPRRESRAERKAKSSRSTEQGIAGHQAAMDALNTHNRKTTSPAKDAGPMPRVDYGSPQRAMGPAKGSTKGLTNG